MLPPPLQPPALTPLPTPHYLIHIPPDPRPHHTTLAFLASAYTSWAHRVDTLPPSSLYVKQHLKKDYHEMLCGRPRPSLLLLWALEVVRRGEEEGGGGGRDTVEGVVADFVRGLVECDLPPTKQAYRASTSIPHYCPPVLSLYTSLLSNIITTTNAAHPPLGFYAPGEKLEAIAFDIDPHYARRREQIWGAVRYAVEKGEGRMGEVGRKRGWGGRGEWRVGVRFWVVVGERGEEEGDGEGDGGEGEEEGLPGYERVEGGEEPPGYDEVVVKEEGS